MERTKKYVKGCKVGNDQVLMVGDTVAPVFAEHFARKHNLSVGPSETAVIKRIQKISLPVPGYPDRPVVEYWLHLINCQKRNGRPSTLDGTMADLADGWRQVGEKRTVDSIIDRL